MIAAPSSDKKWRKQGEPSLKGWCHKGNKVDELYGTKQMNFFHAITQMYFLRNKTNEENEQLKLMNVTQSKWNCMGFVILHHYYEKIENMIALVIKR